MTCLVQVVESEEDLLAGLFSALLSQQLAPPPAQVEATPLTETVAESLPSPLNIEATSPSFKGDPDFSLPPSTIQEEEEVAALTSSLSLAS